MHLEFLKHFSTMTKHFKLENGKLIRFDSDGSNETLVDGVDGRIIGITRGDERTGFIFRDGDDLNRLYLDNDGKPMTRLLMLLVSKLERLTDGVVTVTSVTRAGAGRHASRLHLDFSEGNECGDAPYYLPDGAHLRNAERIALVLSALDVMEDVEDDPSEVSSSNAGEPVVGPTVEPASESVVVEGTVQDAVGAGRGVRLVSSLTVLALFYHYELDELCLDSRDGDSDFVRGVIAEAETNLFDVKTISVASVNAAKTVKRGIRLGVSVGRGFLDRVAFITDQDEVRSLLQLHARRMGF